MYCGMFFYHSFLYGAKCMYGPSAAGLLSDGSKGHRNSYSLLTLDQHSHYHAVPTVILAAFILLFFSSYLAASLSQPETQPNYIVGEDGSIKEGKPVPNEHYISGAQRQAYQFLLEFLPQGQCILLLEGSLPIARTFAYDTIIAVFATSIGIFGFQKKDIK